MTLIKLNNKITKCRQCKRLVSFREKIASKKRRQYIENNIGVNLLQVMVMVRLSYL